MRSRSADERPALVERVFVVAVAAVCLASCAATTPPNPAGDGVPPGPDRRTSGCAEALGQNPKAPLDGLPASGLIWRAPHVLREVRTPYPANGCAERREGHVVMRVSITPSGTVGPVSVARSAGSDFDALAVSALEQFLFSPACSRDGVAVPANIVYTYSFLPGDCGLTAPWGQRP